MKRCKLLELMHRFLSDESGPTATEYAVMLALILVAAIVSVTTFGNTLNDQYGNINTTLFPGA